MHTRAHVAASVCARCMHRRGSSIVFHWSRWPRKDGRLRGETRRGEARRSEERRGEARLENGKNGEAGQLHAHAHSPSRVLGPRQLTSDGRKSFYVFIHRSFLPDRYPPSTSPFVASLSRGWDRFEDYRVSCEPARICRSTYWSRFEEIVVRI